MDSIKNLSLSGMEVPIITINNFMHSILIEKRFDITLNEFSDQFLEKLGEKMLRKIKNY